MDMTFTTSEIGPEAKYRAEDSAYQNDHKALHTACQSSSYGKTSRDVESHFSSHIMMPVRVG